MERSVLVIGSGAREDVLSWKISESKDVAHVYVAPGNAGTRKRGQKVSNISLDLRKHSEIADWCKANDVSLVVIGPEDPLADGIVDDLTSAGIQCFGPTAAAARIESSKEFAKDLMRRHGIPTARWEAFSNAVEACQFIQKAEFPALVVKASGLAAGKGVVVAADKEEAMKAVKDILEDRVFGDAGTTVVIEELLVGEEVSCLAFSDGRTVVCMPPAQDHKRLLEGNRGPNTGGMGAYCPCSLISEADLDIVKNNVLQKTVDVLREAGTPFVGVLYAGLMLTKDGPKVLEFNCRFGDPETQVLIPLLKSDIYQVMNHCVNGTLSNFNVEFDSKSSALGIVLASKGYPGTYPKGLPITGVDRAESHCDVRVFYAGASCDDDDKVIVTNGGRVLTIVAVDSSLQLASNRAQTAAGLVVFDGKQYRKDIAYKSLHSTPSSSSACTKMTYKDSGVDIDAGDDLVEKIKSFAASTARPGCCPSLGQFGGMFDMELLGHPDLVLVSGTDGVGTKLKIAYSTNIHNTVGIDLVAMSVNDVLCQGAEPLFFLDYFACSHLDVETAKSVIEGIAVGCRQAGCALIGGETAEMPGIYQHGEYDLAGFVTGCVKKPLMLPKVEDIKEGDVVLGLTSSGLHSNGFSFVRKVVESCGLSYDVDCPFDAGKSFGQYLLTPTKIYVKCLVPILHMENKIKGLAHITGGGLPGNVPRVLPSNLRVILDAASWVVPPIFGWIAEKGNVDPGEMLRTFNCGIGMVVIVGNEQASEVQRLISELGEQALVIGHVTARHPGDEAVTVNNFVESLNKTYNDYRLNSDSSVVNCVSPFQLNLFKRKRVAVLISGSGTNLQALIDFTKDPANKSAAEIVLVISNVDSALGLRRAAEAGIPSKCISHKNYKSREEFDEAVDRILVEENIDIVCLAGFMRILSEPFVKRWNGRMLNTHPSLLPSFKGAHAHKMALEAGVRVSGCTVHFVAMEVDAGAIVAQESVPVYPEDTEDTLSERVKAAEHKVYPKALELLASGKLMLAEDGRIKWL